MLTYSRYYAFSLLLSLILTVSALLLNNYLIPVWGMEGAAMSNLFSYGLYYILIIATVVPLCRVRIMDKKWWVILALILTLFALNWAWITYLPSFGLWTDSLLRSVIILGTGAAVAYFAKLSPEINQQLHSIVNKS